MKPPRLFDDVMEIVARIKNSKGPTFQHIVHEVQTELRKKNVSVKNVFELVKEALLYGTKSGLIIKKEGHYQIALSKEDYTIYKKFRSGDGHLTSDESVKSFDSKKKGSSRSETSESEEDDDSASGSGSSVSSKSGTSGTSLSPNRRSSQSGKGKSQKQDQKSTSGDSNQHGQGASTECRRNSRNSGCRDSRHSSASQRIQKDRQKDDETCEVVRHQSYNVLHHPSDEFVFTNDQYTVEQPQDVEEDTDQQEKMQ